jgi:hypothetical protein
MLAALVPRGRWLAAATIATWLLVAPATSAADGDPEQILDRRIVDVAVIDRGDGLWPDLLTLETLDPLYSTVRVTLLRREVAWSILAETNLDVDRSFDSIPWLVDLGDGRFAVVLVVGQPESVVLPLRVEPSSRVSPLRVGAPIAIENMVSGTGAADVDGDGARELVVASPMTDDPGSCQGDKVEVLFGDDLQERDTFVVPAMRLAGAALGEWDGRPGADLLANAFEACPDVPDHGERHHLLAIRLRDGSTIVDIPAAEGDPTAHLPSLPLVVDVDDDGRDEAIVRTGSAISIVDPTDGWRSSTIAVGNVSPLVAMRSSIGPSPAIVSWLRMYYAPGQFGVGSARITRVDGSLSVGTSTSQALPDVPPDELEGGISRFQDIERSQGSLQVWTADLDGDGCPEVVAPLVRAGCLGTGDVAPGPLLLDTRPLAVIGPAGERRVLTALGLMPVPGLGLAQFPFEGGLFVPAPAAAGAAGAWRSGPSATFALTELPMPTGAVGPVTPVAATPVAAPLVDSFASVDGFIDVSGPTGSRLLIRAVGLGATDTEASPDVLTTRQGFLQAELSAMESTGVLPIPVAVGTIPGATLGSAPLDIMHRVWTPDVRPPFRWRVVVAALDAWGNVSDPVVANVIYDVTAPTLEVEVPFLTAPWPLDAALVGTSEAGTTVRIGDGPSVTLADDGPFEVRTQLAPWPQTLEVTAVDPSGNATTTRVSVMGGVDLRQLPWPEIAAVTIIAAVLVSSLRGGRHGPSVAVATAGADGDHVPEIEELGEGPVGR